MSDWIKVSESEPLPDLFVIAYLPDVGFSGIIDYGWLGIEDGEKEFCLNDDHGTKYDWDLVTHWMPWPEPPK